MTPITTFDRILDMIDTLSVEEQNDIIDIVRHRQIEQRREEIANNITLSRQEYERGEVFRGTVDDIIAELNND